MAKTKAVTQANPTAATVSKLDPKLREAVKKAAAKQEKPFPEAYDTELVRISLIAVGKNIRQKEVTLENDPGLAELAESIKRIGVQVPLIVKEYDDGGGYALISGHRRLAASKLAERMYVPCRVYAAEDTLTERQILEIQISENLHRKDLLPVEEAAVYERMRVDLDMNFEEIALRVGKSQKHIHRYIKLLSLPQKVLDSINSGEMSLAKAQILCSLPKSAIEIIVTKKDYLLRGNYTVKEFEDAVDCHFIEDLRNKYFDKKKQYRGKDGKIYPACFDKDGKMICPHKGQLEMFEEYAAEDKCPFADCYNDKRWIVEEQKRNDAKKKSARTSDEGEEGGDDPERCERERLEREARWARESEEEAAERKTKTEYYIEHRIATKKFGTPSDFFFARGDDAFDSNYSNDIDGPDTVLEELFVKHTGKNPSQLKENGTGEEVFKAMAIYYIYDNIDNYGEEEIARRIGCEEYPEEKDGDGGDEEGEDGNYDADIPDDDEDEDDEEDDDE